MALDLTKTLTTIKNRQWALGDIDWEAPGAELIPDEQKAGLKDFMADLVWIEHVGARAFAALAKSAPTDQLKEIYRYFHAEEQRHANAELALMRRWGLLEDDEVPEPNINIKYMMDLLERYADSAPFSMGATGIPMLEVALDGALLKFLTDQIEDPVCHQVFAKINNDESRHLAVGYHVIGLLGAAPVRLAVIDVFKLLVRVRLVTLPALIAAAPIVPRMRDNLVKMGMDPERLFQALDRYLDIGERYPDANNVPMYRISRRAAKWLVERNPVVFAISDTLLRLADLYPKWMHPKPPSWSNELTYEAVQ